MNKVFCIFCLFVSNFSPAAADSGSELRRYSVEYQSCMAAAGSNGDAQNTCKVIENHRLDAELNTVFLREKNLVSPYRRDLLVKSERLWIQFRDAECEFRGSILIGGPQGIEEKAQIYAKTDCILEQTASRLEVLRHAVSDAKFDVG